MIKIKASSILIFSLLFSACQLSNRKEPENIQQKKRVADLISQMTLEQKAGQMTQLGIPALCIQKGYWDKVDTLILDTIKLKKALLEDHIGSFIGKGNYPPSRNEYYHLIKQIQDFAVNKTRLGIPIVYATDGVHGAHYTEKSTIFPHQIAMAATWNPNLMKKMGEITAYELRASNTAWNFAPVIDISWQGQWGRIYETFGEDPYLTSMMGKAFIQGSQGKDMSAWNKTAICLKHLIGYGSPLYGKDRKNAMIPERYLRQYYLPPFEEALREGAMSVMISSGLVNGIPSHVNHFLITELLKEELGFEGLTISDWGDMQFLSEFHKTAENHKQAVKQMVNAGIDLCMVPYDASFAKYVVELVQEGEIAPSRIDDAVERILRFKEELGLFEKPNTHFKDYPDFGSEKFSMESRKAASEALTLLKNKQILPLKKGKKILVAGLAGNSLNYLNGPWTRSWSGQDPQYNDEEKNTIFEAIQNKNGLRKTQFIQGSNFHQELNIKEAIRQAERVDYIVVCLGEELATERPSDIKELLLPEAQRNLVKAMHKTGKPIILLLLEGRSRIISDIEPLVDGIIMAYYPGHEGGDAIAEVLFGDINPSGKLPFTYQKHAASPMPYIHSVSDRSDNYGGYSDYDPQWPFGFGLSYAEFKYESLGIEKQEISINDSLNIRIKISNQSSIPGKEVVQLYIRDDYASIDPDFERLIRFEKVYFNPGESKEIIFTISSEDLGFIDAKNKWKTEVGSFTLTTGDLQNQILKQKFILH